MVQSLSLAMSGGQAMVLPLLQLKEFDQYTTTHAINVAVLTMGLASSSAWARERCARSGWLDCSTIWGRSRSRGRS